MVARSPSGRRRWSPLFIRLPGILWVSAAVLALGVALAGAPALNPSDVDSDRGAAGAAGGGRPAALEAHLAVREGSEIADQLGHFRVTDGRVVFLTADGKRRLVGLENLSLERVARAIDDTPQTLQWSVSGVITEYRGVNYLLVRRAILKSGSRFARDRHGAGP